MEIIKQRKGSAGAIAKNKITSELASIKYYLNPSIYKECNNIIHPIKTGNKTDFAGARIKKFCNHSCNAIYHNRKRVKKFKEKVIKERLPNSTKGIIPSLDNTKEYYKNKYKDWWSARVPIAKTARKIYKQSNKDKCCTICGYDKHYEVCHIKAVSEFEDSATLREINDINNLVALCRNHHWEYDKGLIEL